MTMMIMMIMMAMMTMMIMPTWMRKMAARPIAVPTQKDCSPGILLIAPTWW